MRHRDARLNHIIENWTFADQATREALVGALPEDVGKISFQQSDNTYWRMADDSPVTWVALAPPSGGGGGNEYIVSSRKVAPADLTSSYFDFTAIPLTHRNLRLTFTGRSEFTGLGGANDSDLLFLLINGIGALFVKSSQIGDAAPVQSKDYVAHPYGVEVAECAAFNDADFGIGSTLMVLEILNYSQSNFPKVAYSKNIVVSTNGTTTTRNEYGITTDITPAITELRLQANSGSFVDNSICTLELFGKI